MRSLIALGKLLFGISVLCGQSVFAEQQRTDATAGCEPGSAACAASVEPKATPQFIAYYFHGDKRCVTCRGIETSAERVIRQSFDKELLSGKLSWRAVNIDEPENKHFVSEFNLYASALVIVDATVGSPARSINLEKVWPLAHNEPAFDSYIVDEVRKFMGPANG